MDRCLTFQQELYGKITGYFSGEYVIKKGSSTLPEPALILPGSHTLKWRFRSHVACNLLAQEEVLYVRHFFLWGGREFTIGIELTQLRPF